MTPDNITPDAIIRSRSAFESDSDLPCDYPNESEWLATIERTDREYFAQYDPALTDEQHRLFLKHRHFDCYDYVAEQMQFDDYEIIGQNLMRFSENLAYDSYELLKHGVPEGADRDEYWELMYAMNRFYQFLGRAASTP